MATTVTSPSIKAEYSAGNKRVVLASITTIANAQTWDVPLKNITGVFITPNSAKYGGYTVGSGSTSNQITFAVSATMTDTTVMVIGD